MEEGKPVNKKITTTNAFGGCNRLLIQYQTIGLELVLVEQKGSTAAFREGVSFVPVEVLESYLEDLLELSVSEDTLNICLATDNADSIEKIFNWFKKLFPQIRLMRRIRFARIVSSEVSRRRGRDGTTRTPILSLKLAQGS